MNVKKLRMERGLSQKGLADATNIPKGRINGWEQKGTQPKTKDYATLKAFFEIKDSHPTNDNSTSERKSEAETEKLIDTLSGIIAKRNKTIAELKIKLSNCQKSLLEEQKK